MKKALLLISIILLAWGCREDDFDQQDYAVLSSRLVELSEEGALLEGQIISRGQDEITQVGFQIGESPDQMDAEIPIDGNEKVFRFMLNEEIDEGTRIYFRSYARGPRYRSLGNLLSFVSPGFILEDPEVLDFYPRDAIPGSHITLIGKHLGRSINNATIQCGDFDCPIQSLNPDTLIFTLPGLAPDSYVFTLKVYEKEVEFGSIEVHGPEISDFKPKSGYDSTVVTITGNYFGTNPVVYFGTDSTQVLYYSDSLIVTLSPLTSQAGPVDLRIESMGNSTIATADYEIREHNIYSISPLEGKVGDRVTIIGEGFIQNNRESIVYFGDAEATVTSSSESMLELTVPIPGEPGPVDIQVRNGMKSKTYDVPFNILYSWTQTEPFPGTPMQAAISIVLDEMAYVGMGNADETLNPTREWWRFDPAGGGWTRLSDFPGTPRADARAVSARGKIYVVFGRNDEQEILFTECWEYDPGLDQWTRKNDPPEIGEGNWFLSACSYEDKGYLQVFDAIHVYDPVLDQWTERSIPEMNYNPADHSTPIWYNVSGRLFALMGDNMELNTKGYTTAYEYLPESDEWIQLASSLLEHPRYSCSFSLDGKCYFGGGTMGIQYYEFDPETRRFSEVQPFHHPMSNQVAFTIAGTAYVGMGINSEGRSLNELWIFDPR